MDKIMTKENIEQLLADFLVHEGSTRDFVDDYFNALPDAPRWIPVKEGKPIKGFGKSKLVLIMQSRGLEVKIGRFRRNPKGTTRETWVDKNDSYLWNVIAWRPMPEPFKEGE